MRHITPQNNRKIGFTLIELLVVVSIIMVLVAILLPALSQAIQTAKDVRCSTKLRQTSLAIINYAADNHGTLYKLWDNWQGPALYDTRGGPAVEGGDFLRQQFVPGYLPSLETWSCTFSEVPNIEDPRNTRGWTYGSFIYWPLNGEHPAQPDFNTTNDGYPLRISAAKSSTPLVQDKISDNRSWRYAPGWVANHTTDNYWIWTAMNNVNPSNVNRRTDEVRDVRGGNIATFDMSVTWYTMSELKVATVDTHGRPHYSNW